MQLQAAQTESEVAFAACGRKWTVKCGIEWISEEQPGGLGGRSPDEKDGSRVSDAGGGPKFVFELAN